MHKEEIRLTLLASGGREDVGKEGKPETINFFLLVAVRFIQFPPPVIEETVRRHALSSSSTRWPSTFVP